MIRFMLLLLVLTSLASCSKVNQGQGGIVTSINGSISSELRSTGWEVTVLDSMETIDLTQNIIVVDEISLKDKDNINLRDFDANITFDTVASGAVSFFVKTRSITEIRDENGDYEYVLGYKIVKMELVNQLQKTIAQFQSKDIQANREVIEKSVKEGLQKTLDERFGKVFEIVNVNVNKILLDESVEKSLQLIQVTKNNQQELAAQQEQVKAKKELLDAELSAKSSVVSKYGMTMKEYLELEIKRDFNKALEKSNIQLHLKKD